MNNVKCIWNCPGYLVVYVIPNIKLKGKKSKYMNYILTPWLKMYEILLCICRYLPPCSYNLCFEILNTVNKLILHSMKKRLYFRLCNKTTYIWILYLLLACRVSGKLFNFFLCISILNYKMGIKMHIRLVCGLRELNEYFESAWHMLSTQMNMHYYYYYFHLMVQGALTKKMSR